MSKEPEEKDYAEPEMRKKAWRISCLDYSNCDFACRWLVDF